MKEYIFHDYIDFLSGSKHEHPQIGLNMVVMKQ